MFAKGMPVFAARSNSARVMSFASMRSTRRISALVREKRGGIASHSNDEDGDAFGDVLRRASSRSREGRVQHDACPRITARADYPREKPMRQTIDC